jgi:hypothetical protein
VANVVLTPALAAKISSRDITATWPAQRNASQWTGGDKILLLAGIERHRFAVTFRPLVTENEIREARAFFYTLRGMVNTFELPYLPTPQAGTPTVVTGGGAAGSNTFSVTSAAGIVAGAPISVALPSGHKRVFIVTGIAGLSITVEPAFSEDAIAGNAVEIANPVCRVRLADPSLNYTDDMGRASFGFEAVEAIEA